MINNNDLSNDINPFFFLFFILIFIIYNHLFNIYINLIKKADILNIKTSFNIYKNCIFIYIIYKCLNFFIFIICFLITYAHMRIKMKRIILAHIMQSLHHVD